MNEGIEEAGFVKVQLGRCIKVGASRTVGAASGV